MFLVIYADENERPFINWKHIKSGILQGYSFSIYEYKNKEIILVHSGIGITLAAACTELFTYHFKIEMVFNFGAVGCSNNDFNILDVLIPEKIYYHDVKTPWYPRGQIPTQAKYFLNDYKNTDNINLETGMTFVGQKDILDDINADMDLDIFDMEAAGIAQICYKNKLKFICIKGISDLILKTNNEINNINELIKKAGKQAFLRTQQIIDDLCK